MSEYRATRDPDILGATDPHERPIGELLRELANETSTLLRQELDLAKAEMTQKAKQAGIGVGMFGAAGVLGFLALGALTECFIAALSLAMPVWLASLIIVVVYVVVAACLALTGKARIKKAVPPAPEKTVQSIKEDVEWAKIQARSGRQ
jgi:hypothetical protein